MNIEIKANKTDLLKKICKETEMNPSQLIDYFLDIVQHLYSDYERQKNAGVEKGSLKEVLTNIFLDKSKLRTPDIAKRLIESTNELLGINEYIDAGIYNIDLDFYSRSFFYTIGYEFCVDAANMNAYKGLLIGVEINQDYIEVSHVVNPPMLENMEITDKKMNYTSNLVQEFIRDIHHEEFSPFVTIEIKIFPIWDYPFGPSSEARQSIGIKLIVKADKVTYMPFIEKISLLIREAHAIVLKELLAL